MFMLVVCVLCLLWRSFRQCPYVCVFTRLCWLPGVLCLSSIFCVCCFHGMLFCFCFVFCARREKCASACYQAELAAGWEQLRRRSSTRSTTRRQCAAQAVIENWRAAQVGPGRSWVADTLIVTLTHFLKKLETLVSSSASDANPSLKPGAQLHPLTS